MRQVNSYGSAKGISLNRDKLLNKLYTIAQQALIELPEIHEARLIGSLTRGHHSGLSDLDLSVAREYLACQAAG